ncbi:MAG: 1-acyl-sn-glycerol-3-phosphate acyltransferase, partial [Gemmataceae bacterium]|nr:1-acyl-sn-glycerol-3-phosphate acyltransferase [Gemmataceae bacterium]
IVGAIAALGSASLAFYGFFRELLELLVEPLLGIMYRIRAAGPGVHRVPTRGPTVIIANHAAWFDPLWVAKVLPLRVRPMMTARFYDLPCISWLMRRVFFTIRVPEARFRRQAPEIDIAVQAIDQGDNLLIFPEGWLKRREEQSLRRFGHGIHEILRRRPQTPVIACWIEGGWGSYVSYKGGPPTVNKRIDLLRAIRIGISEPEYLPEDLLRDHWRTRRYLMMAVLRARTHLGLPELPLAFPETNDHDGDTSATEDGSSASAEHVAD